VVPMATKKKAPTEIPGFKPHGARYRARVTLDASDAAEVSADAQARGTTVSAVIRERVRKGWQS